MIRVINRHNGKEVYLIKIGGSVITETDRPQTAKRDEIARLLKEIYDAKEKNGFDIVIGHGGGSFPHISAKKYRVNEGLVNDESHKGASITKGVASDLNRIVVETGLELGMPLFSVSPSSFAVADDKKLVDGSIAPIKTALDKGFIPVVYGDVVMDKKQGVSIASTEEVLRFLAVRMKPRKVVIGTDVDGLFDKDPTKFKDAQHIKEVNRHNFLKVLSCAAGAHKIDVTGGMKTKIALLYSIVENCGGVGYIANAMKAGTINAILSDYLYNESDFTVVRA